MKYLKTLGLSLVLGALLMPHNVISVKANDKIEVNTQVKKATSTTGSAYVDSLILHDVNLDEILKKYNLHQAKFYIHPIPVGTSNQDCIGYILLSEENRNTVTAMIPIKGDMLEGFDSSKEGVQYYKFKGDWNINGIFGVDITIQKDADLSKVGKVQSIKVEDFRGYSGKFPYTLPLGITTIGHYGYDAISLLDDLGNIIAQADLTADMIQEFESFQKGKKEFIVKFENFSTTVTIDFREYYGEFESFPLSVGTNIDEISGFFATYDKDSNYWLGAGQGGLAFDFVGTHIKDVLKVNEVGIQEFDLKVRDKSTGEIYPIHFKFYVGVAEASELDQLLTEEAKASMPSQDVVGSYDLPSGDAGAGTWLLPTKLKENEGVDVYTYHNDAWLKVGEYYADKDGNVEVTFTADQLSPVVLFKNGKVQEIVEDNNEQSSQQTDNVEKPTVEEQSDSSQNEEQHKENNEKGNITASQENSVEKAPETNDDTNTYALWATLIVSLFGVFCIVKKKLEKI